MRKAILTALMVPLLAVAGWAEGWTHTAATWNHPGTTATVNVPAGLKGDLDKDGDLTVQADGVYVALFPMNSGDDAAKVQDALKQGIMQQMPGINMGELHKGDFPNGHVEAYATKGSAEGTPMEVTAGTLSNNGHYMVFMTIVHAGVAEQYKKQIDSLMDSITFK